MDMKRKVQHWQYKPYGTRRHNFAFYWLTGHNLWESIGAAMRRPYRYTDERDNKIMEWLIP